EFLSEKYNQDGSRVRTPTKRPERLRKNSVLSALLFLSMHDSYDEPREPVISTDDKEIPRSGSLRRSGEIPRIRALRCRLRGSYPSGHSPETHYAVPIGECRAKNLCGPARWHIELSFYTVTGEKMRGG